MSTVASDKVHAKLALPLPHLSPACPPWYGQSSRSPEDLAISLLTVPQLEPNIFVTYTPEEVSYLFGWVNETYDEPSEPPACIAREEYERLYGNTSSNGNGTAYSGATTLTIPDSFNWNTTGFVSPAKDQGKCRSCWAFAAAAAIETLWASKQGFFAAISTQAFVDCQRPPLASATLATQGCSGKCLD